VGTAVLNKVNTGAVRAVVAAIEAEVHAWDQNYLLGSGECGTTRCLAGWAVHLAGLDLAAMCAASDVDYIEVLEKARELLGLSEAQADDLFLNFGMIGKQPTVAELKARVTAVTGVTFE